MRINKKVFIIVIAMISIWFIFNINSSKAVTIENIIEDKFSLKTTSQGNLIAGFSPNTKVSGVINKVKNAYKLQAFDLSNLVTVKVLNKNNEDITNNSNTLVGTGDKIQIYNNSKLVKTYTIVMYGDTNGDGKANAVDALIIIKNRLGSQKINNELYLEASRVTDSKRPGSVLPNSADALSIVLYNLSRNTENSDQYDIKQEFYGANNLNKRFKIGDIVQYCVNDYSSCSYGGEKIGRIVEIYDMKYGIIVPQFLVISEIVKGVFRSDTIQLWIVLGFDENNGQVYLMAEKNFPRIQHGLTFPLNDVVISKDGRTNNTIDPESYILATKYQMNSVYNSQNNSFSLLTYNYNHLTANALNNSYFYVIKEDSSGSSVVDDFIYGYYCTQKLESNINCGYEEFIPCICTITKNVNKMN